MRRLLLVGTLVAALAWAAPASTQAPAPAPCAADAPVTSSLAATTNTPGVIRLFLFLAQGAEVTYYECEGEKATYLGKASQPGDVTALDPAAFWRCDRLTRNFAAMATLPDGSLSYGVTDVRTMSCAHRYSLSAPARAARGTRLPVRVFDRWDRGAVRGRLCVTAPHARRDCRALRLAAGVNVATRSVRLRRRGRYRLDFRAPHVHLRDSVAVGVKAARPPDLPMVLATGDSTMMGVESFLADDLAGRADVYSDVFPGASFSHDEGWAELAAKQVAAHHPDVTVLSVGANEGYGITIDGREHLCCDDAWVAEWRRRMARVIRIYRQGGRGEVVLLTIQLPKAPNRVPIFKGTNAIISGFEGTPGVRLLHLDELFSPNGYQESIVYQGREVKVREPDGIHLNVAGTSIAARVIVTALASELD